MKTWREIVYMCLDEIKSISDDSIITEEHVIFLANHYRNYLIELKIKLDGEHSLSLSNYQTICLDLEVVPSIPGMEPCGDIYLKSKQLIPSLVKDDMLKVYPYDYFSSIKVTPVTRDRFRVVGFNPFMNNIIYCTLGLDNHIYFKGVNPLFQYLESAKASGVFEDAEQAANLSCDNELDSVCDFLDKDFPLDSSLIPQLLEYVVKVLSSAVYRPEDTANNAKDDLSDLMQYVRSNMKQNYARQLE